MSGIISAVLSLSLLAVPVLGSTETMTSPGIGRLDSRFSQMGGIVIDILGVNGKRLTAQVSPTKLANGWPTSANKFWSVWTQSGIDSYTLTTLLGGGLSKVNIRVTLQDGDSASPNPVYSSFFGPYSFPWGNGGHGGGNDFDAGTDLYLAIRQADGTYINAGYMGQTQTYRLDADGNRIESFTGFPGVFAITDPRWSTYSWPPQYQSPFAVTGWFSVPADQLAALYQTLSTQHAMELGIWDFDPGDQYFDFTQGAGSDIVDIPLVPAHIVSFQATPSSVFGSGTVTLSWRAESATSVSIDNGVSIVPTSFTGSTTVNVATTTTYTLTAVGTGGTDTAAATVNVLPPLSAPGTALPSGLVATPYSAALSALGGTTPYAWSITAGTLPPGLVLNTTGTITGTPTTSGTWSFMAKVMDSTAPQMTATVPLSLTITPALAITTSHLPDAVVGTPYNQPLSATGGTPPYFWTVTAGALPAGLSLTSDGTISGTPTTPGTSKITILAVDSTTPTAQTRQRSYTLTVGSRLSIQTTTLPAGNAGRSYSQTLTAAGGTNPYAWSIDSGSLPAGLSLAANGTISGTPATPGLAAFTVRCTDTTSPVAQTTTQQLSLFIVSPLTITTTTLPDGIASRSYVAALTVTDGVQPYLWSLASGSLPPGIQLLASGALIGTPSTPGDFGFMLKVSDSSYPVSLTTTQSYTLHVTTAFSITTLALPAGTTGLPYTATIQAVAGTAPYTMALIFGNLPPGLTLNPDGSIGGTPTQPGSYNLLIRAVDSSLPAPQTSDRAYTIAIDANLTIVTPNLPDGTQNLTYNQTLIAINGTLPYTWSVASGTLPPGLSLLQSGVLLGIPSTEGTYTFALQVKDASQPTAAVTTRGYSLKIAQPLVVINPSLPNGIIDAPYTAVITTTGGVQPYTYSLAGDTPLPPGLSLSPIGTITGTPTTAGTYPITLRVTDSGAVPAHIDKLYTIGINEPLTVPDPHLPPAIVGLLYTQQLTPEGGLGPYTWTIESGALPQGLALLGPGILIGTPTTAGDSTLTLRVTDSMPGAPHSALRTITLHTYAPLTPSDQAPTAVTPNVPYSGSFNATGGVAPYTWTVAAGTLPAGLSLASNGSVSGVATTPGAYPITVSVSDSTQPSQSVSREYILLVSSPFAITTLAPMRPAIVGAPYSQGLTLVNGRSPFACSILSGALPAGMTLSNDGLVAGTASEVSTAQFLVSCTDAAGQAAQRALTLPVQEALSIVAANVPTAITGVPYYHAFRPSGGTAGFIWSVTSGALPAGLSLTTDGLIIGMTPLAGRYPLTLSVTDSTAPTSQRASADITLVVAPALSALSQHFVAMTSSAFAQTVRLTGGTPPYSWTLASGSLPPGLTLAPDGSLTGTPTQPGPFAAALSVSDSTGQHASAAVTFAVSQALAIPLSSTPDGVVGVPYAATLYATGGVTPYRWTVSTGTLPPGLALSIGGGITGIPTTAGTYTFNASVNTGVEIQSRQLTLVINPAPAALTIPASSTALPRATVGSLYHGRLVVTGTTAPVKWTLTSGTLPPGLSLAPDAITGTPTAAGTYSFALTVRDGDRSASSNFALTIDPPLLITTTTLGNATASVPYAAALAASGGLSPYTWSVAAGSLPDGLFLSGTGILSGTPATAGAYSFTLAVSDSSATPLAATKPFSVSVGGPLTITTSTLPLATVGASYSFSLSAANGTLPYNWTLADGTLPPGLLLATNGTISGTPTQEGSRTALVKVTDAARQTATRQILITTQPAISITSSRTVSASIGSAVSIQLAATGGAPPYVWATAAATLPPGLSLTASGVLAGIPTQTGTTSTVISVTDAQQHAASASFTFTITNQSISLTITPDGRSLQAATQSPVSLRLSSPSSTDLSGLLTVSGSDDQDLGFLVPDSTPSRSARFTLPAGSTSVDLPALQTGTVASTLTLSATLAGSTQATNATNRVLSSVPIITSTSFQQTTNGFEIVIQGYSPTREVSAATFRFFGPSGISSAPSAIDVSGLFSGWYRSPASRGSGIFAYRQPFTLSGALALTSVEVSLTNSVGTSSTEHIATR